jgi:hypothetical protein
MVAIQDIERAVANARQGNSLFVNKAALDAFVGAGREAKAGVLVRALVGGLKQGYSPPFVFVYGRTSCRIRAHHARNAWKDFVDL